MTLESVTVEIHPPPNHEEQKITLKIDPPLENGFEARERLTEWQVKAYEHFDVVRIVLPISHLPCSFLVMSVGGS